VGFAVDRIVSQKRYDREFADEVESHLQMRTADKLLAGMSAQEARRQALLKLGGIEATKEIYRELPSFFIPTISTNSIGSYAFGRTAASARAPMHASSQRSMRESRDRTAEARYKFF
jgi:hypothetical protein